jgi:Zn-dependent alcohol dehydrogenase
MCNLMCNTQLKRNQMVHKVKAVIAREKNAPVSVETILVPDPGPGEPVWSAPSGRVSPRWHVGLLGCGVMAGIGAAIIAANKVGMAKALGATHGVDSSREDPVEAIRALTGGNGADLVFDAVGRPETYKQAFYARDLAGGVGSKVYATPRA